MDIAFIHNMEITLDARTQKEVNSLIRNGHNVHFCGWNKEIDGHIEKREVLLRDRIFQFENICVKVKKRAGLKENIRPLFRYYIELSKWLNEHNNEFDVLHACNMDTALVALLYSKKNHKKLIYDIYDDYADSHVVGKILYKILKKIDAYIIHRANAVIICSEKRSEQLATKKTKKVIVLHNTPDIENVDSTMMKLPSSSKLRLAYVGNLDETRYIIELASIVERHPEWELHIGGGGAIEKQIKQISSNYDNIFYYGRLSYEQTLSLEDNCDVLPALYIPTVRNHKYAAPNKFYEALYLGKPTIMFRNTGVDDLVKLYRTGEVVEFSTKALEQAIQKIESQRDYWKNSEIPIREICYKNFSWRVMETRLLNMYKNL